MPCLYDGCQNQAKHDAYCPEHLATVGRKCEQAQCGNVALAGGKCAYHRNLARRRTPVALEAPPKCEYCGATDVHTGICPMNCVTHVETLEELKAVYTRAIEGTMPLHHLNTHAALASLWKIPGHYTMLCDIIKSPTGPFSVTFYDQPVFTKEQAEEFTAAMCAGRVSFIGFDMRVHGTLEQAWTKCCIANWHKLVELHAKNNQRVPWLKHTAEDERKSEYLQGTAQVNAWLETGVSGLSNIVATGVVWDAARQHDGWLDKLTDVQGTETPQANKYNLRFRYAKPTTMCWLCKTATGPAHTQGDEHKAVAAVYLAQIRTQWTEDGNAGVPTEGQEHAWKREPLIFPRSKSPAVSVQETMAAAEMKKYESLLEVRRSDRLSTPDRPCDGLFAKDPLPWMTDAAGSLKEQKYISKGVVNLVYWGKIWTPDEWKATAEDISTSYIMSHPSTTTQGGGDRFDGNEVKSSLASKVNHADEWPNIQNKTKHNAGNAANFPILSNVNETIYPGQELLMDYGVAYDAAHLTKKTKIEADLQSQFQDLTV